jgi:hypothetical protein
LASRIPFRGGGAAGLGGQLHGFFGAALDNETVKAIVIWQVLQALVSPLLEPLVAEIRQQAFSHFPDLPLSPADAVDAAIKSHMSVDKAAAEAAKSGIGREAFDLLLASAALPPGMEFLLTAYRRGLIGKAGEGAESTSLEQGIRDSRIKNKWIPLIEEMRVQPITAHEAILGWVKGQLTESEAIALAYQGGLSEDSARQIFNITGNPPSPMEAAELLRRGYIPLEGVGPDVLSFQQAIYEGVAKNKWWPMFAKLAEYWPPPRTVTAMVREGALSDEEALHLFKGAGLSEHLAAAYLAAAHHQKTQHTRDLAKGDVNTLYYDHIISGPEHTQLLGKLGYSAHDAEFEQKVQDFRRNSALITQATTRVRSLFVAHKITEQQAGTALDELQIPSGQKGQLLRTWKLERALSVHTLTFGEIVAAHHYNLIQTDEAMSRLGQLGYGPRDAWILLANREHARLTTPMPADNTPPV